MTATLADEGATYRIRVQGRVEPLRGRRLGDLVLAVHDGGAQTVTDLTGWIVDQAALMGVLEQLYSLGVTLLNVERVNDDVTGNGR